MGLWDCGTVGLGEKKSKKVKRKKKVKKGKRKKEKEKRKKKEEKETRDERSGFAELRSSLRYAQTRRRD